LSESQKNEAFLAGRLLQWGLRVRSVPFNHDEYRELLDRYIDQPAFRTLVREIASGLGLIVLDATSRGLFLGTEDESVFGQKPSQFRGSTSAEERLLDGLVHVAIAATIYPRQQDLDEDSIEAKPPITAVEVDETLRSICSEFRQRNKDEPDVESDAIGRGLLEAWRVYEKRPGVKTTAKGNVSPSSTQSIIRKHLQTLVDHGCFLVTKRSSTELYRPTLRYQIQVKELAATKLYRYLQALLQESSNLKTDDDLPVAEAMSSNIGGTNA
jgi:hypothetical protein